MNIFLKHDKKLHYNSSKYLPPCTIDLNNAGTSNDVHISFRKNNVSDITIDNVTACTRFTDIPDGNVVFHGVESDSPLAPLILWDCAHTRSIGQTIILNDETFPINYLERNYFKDGITIESKDGTTTVLRKVKQLPVEKYAGLDDWTFGIPVGPEDATLLNYVVKRILDIPILHKEILLCGVPGKNFKYLDDVRIVGKDIKSPPLRIATKKNRLADEASYNNICILHDRVYLPLDFHAAILKFGDLFPMVSMQCLYFTDKYNFIPRRYSDYNSLIRGLYTKYSVICGSKGNLQQKTFHKETIAELEARGTVYANPLRYSLSNYATGSLYISKTNLFRSARQDDSLHWEEFEDGEFGNRLSEHGIPTRINPHAFTQSLTSRPLLSYMGMLHTERKNGKIVITRFKSELLPVPKKPLLKVSKDNAIASMINFCKKYHVKYEEINTCSFEMLNIKNWLKLYYTIISKSCFPLNNKSIRQFIVDIEKMLIFDHDGVAQREARVREFIERGNMAKESFLQNYTKLNGYVADRFWQKKIFYMCLKEYLQKKSFLLKIGSCISAFMLATTFGNYIYHPGGFFGIYKSILKTTPFEEHK